MATPVAIPYADAVEAFCRQHRLTPREEQIVHRVCSGMSNASMAAELGISNATVRLHIGNVHRKLGTTSKVDLVVRVWTWSMSGHDQGQPDPAQQYAGCHASA